jgi:hypothetical protein
MTEGLKDRERALVEMGVAPGGPCGYCHEPVEHVVRRYPSGMVHAVESVAYHLDPWERGLRMRPWHPTCEQWRKTWSIADNDRTHLADCTHADPRGRIVRGTRREVRVSEGLSSVDFGRCCASLDHEPTDEQIRADRSPRRACPLLDSQVAA